MTKYATIALLIAALFAIALAPVRTESQQDPSKPQDQKPDGDSDVVRIETDLVTTLFTAVDKDRRFVTNLRAEDLRIIENGVEQEVAQFERETDRPLAIVLLVDTSRSQERILPDEQHAAKQFVASVVRPDRDAVAVVSFTAKPKQESSLTNNVTAINAAIDRIKVEFPPGGCDQAFSPQEEPLCWTSIWDSVIVSSQALSVTRRGFRRAIVLLSDGDDTSSNEERDDAIKSALSNDVVIYGIGLGDPERYSLNKGALRKLAEKTGGRAFFPLGDEELAEAFAQIQTELRSQYVIAYSPKNKARDGSYRKIKLEVVNKEMRDRKLRLVYREGYYAKQK